MADQLANVLTTNASDSIIIKEFLAVVNRFACKGSKLQIVKTLSSGAVRILAIALLQYYIKNSTSVAGTFGTILRTLVYKKYRLKSDGQNDYNFYLLKQLQKEVTPDTYCMGLPVYYSSETIYEGTITMVPGLQHRFFTTIAAIAQIQYDKYVADRAEILTICKTYDKDFKPRVLFPSSNYKRLNAIISRFFQVSKQTKMCGTNGILVDGPPGLGKSASAEFLAGLQEYGEIRHVDMTLLFEKSIRTIITSLLKNRPHSVVIFIDELDKYLKQHLEIKWKEYMEAPVKIPKKHSMDKDDKKKQKEEDPEDYTSKRFTKDEFMTFEKNKFIYELLKILDNKVFTEGAMFVFCSNNFDTIFTGDHVDEIHTQSVRDRFIEVDFNYCDTEEFKDYMRFFNGKLEGCDLHTDEKMLETTLANVRSDLQITYRKIAQFHTKSLYEPMVMVNMINNYTKSDTGSSDEEPMELTVPEAASI